MRKIIIISTLTLSLIVHYTKAQNPGPQTKMNAKQVKVLIDSIGAGLNRMYILPDKAKIISEELKKQYKAGAYNKITEPWLLSMKLTEDMLKAHPDKHMSVRFDPMMVANMGRELSDSDRIQLHRPFLEEQTAGNFAFKKVEVLEDNIGYIRIDGFTPLVEEAQATLKASLEFVKNTKALIIDMRYNGGGNPGMVDEILNHFYPVKTPGNHIISRSPDTLKRYSDPALANGLILKMPIYVLTSKQTFSGGEDLAYNLQSSDRALVIGETTGGGAHPTETINIGQGFVMVVPFAKSVNPFTQKDWEGTGVVPDQPVPASEALSIAQTLIYLDLINKEKDENKKKNLQWNYFVFQNKDDLRQYKIKPKVKLTEKDLVNFCGEYAPSSDITAPIIPITILLKDNYLYRHLNNGAEDVRLIPVSASRLVYDDDTGRALEFLSSDGKINAIKAVRPDGTFILNKK